MKRILSLLAAGLTLTACGSQSTRINAAGATFPAPLYAAWATDYAELTDVEINYQAVGSGAGVRQYTAGTVDFGATDAAISDENIPEQGVVHIPTTGGAIAIVINEPSCPTTMLMTQDQLVNIYLGKITNWSELGCGDSRILPVYRADGSGTTKGFTASLSAFSPVWAEQVGSGKAVAWPVGVGAKGNSGVAAQLETLPGTIGYLNYGYVSQIRDTTTVVALENAAGEFIVPSDLSSSFALGQIVLDDQLRGSDPNPAGTGSYPIVSLTWMLVYPEHAKNEEIRDFLLYILSDEAQEKCDELGYVPLPSDIRLAAIERLNSLES